MFACGFVAREANKQKGKQNHPSLDGKSLEALSNTVSNRVRRRTAEPAEVENGAVRDVYIPSWYLQQSLLSWHRFLWQTH